MSNLVAIAYDDLDEAQKVMGTLGQLVKEHSLTLEDAVIVEHREDGKIKVHQPSMAASGAAGGALWGGLIGLIFLMPLFGMAIGAASGAAAGAASDYGIDDKFMKELGDKLEPGAAAVFVLVKEATRDKVVPEISKYGGHLLQSSLSTEQETALQEALDNRGAPAA
ncbi:MAG TPA: DUF1269 domain-containing protein [Thermoleophilaceae bacterium]|jgi:uncharacterized membrane protein|nr:DUF1269 domain-containing protein [Thermoleophilaceae bacterium]